MAVAHGERLRRLDETARTLGVFSIFIVLFPRPAANTRRHGYDIFIGCPPAALTFLNRPPVFAIKLQA